MERLTLLTRDRKAQYWTLSEAVGIRFTTGENGYMQANFRLDRSLRGLTFAWEDLTLNNQIYLMSARGDLAWHGRLAIVQLSQDKGKINLDCSAVGYWASTYDSFFTGTLGSGTTPQAMLTSLLAYTTQLVNDSTGLISTGLTGQGYQTQDGGTVPARVGDIILDLCRLGTSTTGDRVVPQVWEGRKLVTKRLPATPAAAYSVQLASVASVTVLRDLSAVYNRVLVRYKSSTDNSLLTSTNEDTTQQSIQGVDFTGAGSTTSLLRTTVRDITGLSPTTSTAADAMGNAILNLTKRVHNEIKTIKIEQDFVVMDTALGQEIPNWAVKAGNWIRIPDMFPRVSDPSDASVGTALGDESLQTMFYISQTEFDLDSGALTLTPGAGAGTSGSDGDI
jgi:hypothetical protein